MLGLDKDDLKKSLETNFTPEQSANISSLIKRNNDCIENDLQYFFKKLVDELDRKYK